NAFLREEIAYGAGALLGKLLVVVVTADAIGVALDLQRQPRMREQNSRNFCHCFARTGLQRVASCVEEHIGHVHDEPASAVIRLQNGIQLREKLFAQIGFFGVGFRSGFASFLGFGFGSLLLRQSVLLLRKRGLLFGESSLTRLLGLFLCFRGLRSFR